MALGRGLSAAHCLPFGVNGLTVAPTRRTFIGPGTRVLKRPWPRRGRKKFACRHAGTTDHGGESIAFRSVRRDDGRSVLLPYGSSGASTNGGWPTKSTR
jgi:hypothetical protein